MSPDKMIRMANQIAAFFETQPNAGAPEVAAHINEFWEPRMRAQLGDHLAAGGEGLHPLVTEAAGLIKQPAA